MRVGGAAATAKTGEHIPLSKSSRVKGEGDTGRGERLARARAETPESKHTRVGRARYLAPAGTATEDACIFLPVVSGSSEAQFLGVTETPATRGWSAFYADGR